MARPTQRDVTVNAASSAYEVEDTQPLDFSEDEAPAPPAAHDLGPCLYLGPAGQRCNRRAVEDGFCARHQPGGIPLAGLSIPQFSRRALALFGLIAVLWPVLADVIRELIRWLR
jgi:hypothetical protein